MVSRSTCSTDADDRLPTSLSERQVSSSASSGRPRLAVIASMTFGPPGWLTQAPTSSTFRPCARKELGDVVAQVPLDDRGHVRATAPAGIRSRRRPSPSCAASRGRGGCASRGRRAQRRRSVRRDDRRPPRPPRRRRRTARCRPGVAIDGSARWVGERAQLDRQQHRDAVGCAAQVVVQPGHPGRPGHAAQPEHRHPPDVGAQAQPAGDAGVQRRHRDAGDGRRHDQVDVLRLAARPRRARPTSPHTRVRRRAR